MRITRASDKPEDIMSAPQILIQTDVTLIITNEWKIYSVCLLVDGLLCQTTSVERR